MPVVESSGTLRDADLREAEVRPYAQISRLAVLSLVLGLLGCLVVPIPVALVLGILAVKRIRASKGAVAGMPVAIAGLAAALAMAAGWGIFLHLRARDRERAVQETTENLRQFFDWMSRGYPEDAFTLFSSGGKEKYRPVLQEWQKSLKDLGRFQDVAFLDAEWEGKDQGKLKFAVRFEARLLAYDITIVREKRKWGLDVFSLTGAEQPSAGKGHTH